MGPGPGLLAPSPDNFSYIRMQPRNESFVFRAAQRTERRKPHLITNEGIYVEMDLLPIGPYTYLALLNIGGTFHTISQYSYHIIFSTPCSVGVYLKKLDEENRYARVQMPPNGDNDTLQGLHFVKDRHDVSPRRCQVTVLDTLNDREMKRCYIDMPLRFAFSKLATHTNINEQHLYRGVRAMLGSWNDRKLTFDARYGKYGGLAHIQDFVVSAGKQHTLVLKHVVTGFDYDFHPVCIVAAIELIQLCEVVSQILTKDARSHRTVLWKGDFEETSHLQLVETEGHNGESWGPNIVAVRAPECQWNHRPGSAAARLKVIASCSRDPLVVMA